MSSRLRRTVPPDRAQRQDRGVVDVLVGSGVGEHLRGRDLSDLLVRFLYVMCLDRISYWTLPFESCVQCVPSAPCCEFSEYCWNIRADLYGTDYAFWRRSLGFVNRFVNDSQENESKKHMLLRTALRSGAAANSSSIRECDEVHRGGARCRTNTPH